jgi:phosphate uptake regulator
MSRRRGMLEKVNEPIFEGEIIDRPSTQNQEILERQNERNHQVTMKMLDSLPDAIGIVKDIVSIQRLKAETDGEVRKIEAEIDKLRAQTEDFVRKEIEKRQSFQSKGDRAQNMLRDLYSSLNHSDMSDDLKMQIIEAFNTTMKSVLEEK